MDKFHLLRIDSEFTAALEDSHSCAFQFHPPICTAKKTSHMSIFTWSWVLWVYELGSLGPRSAPNLVLSLRAAAGPLFPSWPPAVTAAKPNRGSRGRVGPQVRSPSHPANNFLAGPSKWGRKYVPVSGFGSSDYEWLQAVRTLTEFWDIGWGVWVVGWVQLWPAI